MAQRTLADGQLAAAATAIITGATACVGDGGVSLSSTGLSLSLCNTSSSLTETVLLTFSRAGGTQRRVARVVLGPNESAYVNNLIIDPGDTLYGTTSDATTVDYMVYGNFTTGPMTIEYYDASGNKKSVSGTPQNVSAVKLNIGPAAVDVYAATMTIDVTKSSHIIAASNGTSAACTMTPSGAGTAGDLLTIITEADGTGTVTVTFAATFHSSGTQATTLSKFSSITFQSDGTRWVELCRTTALT